MQVVKCQLRPCTNVSIKKIWREEKIKKSQMNGRKVSSPNCQTKGIPRIVRIGEKWHCWSLQVKSWVGPYWSLHWIPHCWGTSKLDFAVSVPVQIKWPLLELSLNSHWNGTAVSSWPLSSLKRPLTRWIGRQWMKILEHYGVPGKIINIIQCLYSGIECQVIHDGSLTEPFQVRTGVRQGFLLSPILFLVVLVPDELKEQEGLVYSGRSRVS